MQLCAALPEPRALDKGMPTDASSGDNERHGRQDEALLLVGEGAVEEEEGQGGNDEECEALDFPCRSKHPSQRKGWDQQPQNHPEVLVPESLGVSACVGRIVFDVGAQLRERLAPDEDILELPQREGQKCCTAHDGAVEDGLLPFAFMHQQRDDPAQSEHTALVAQGSGDSDSDSGQCPSFPRSSLRPHHHPCGPQQRRYADHLNQLPNAEQGKQSKGSQGPPGPSGWTLTS